MNKKLILPLIAIAALGTLTACETVPRAERAKIYEEGMRTKFIGKSVDALVLSLGPPEKSHDLTDGRKLFQYEKSADFIQRTHGSVSIGTSFGGGRYGYGSFGSPRFGIGANWPLPQNEYGDSPEISCTERFIINKDNKVEDFAFEGKRCFN